MNSTARQRFAQMMQQEQAQQEQKEMLAKMRTPAPARSAPMGRAGQMMGALKMANGGAVGPLPSLQELSSFDYQYQDPAFGATAPFTQQNPIVPMFNLEAPAYGGMQQSTYDWTAPIVQGRQFAQPQREAPAMVESTSAYAPVDATTLPGGGVNIPNVPVFPDRPQPQPQPVAPPTQPPMEQPMTPPVQPPPVFATAPTGAIPSVITAEERQIREAAPQPAPQPAPPPAPPPVAPPPVAPPPPPPPRQIDPIEAELTKIYKNQLGRAPDSEGLAFWSEAMRNGLSARDITTEIYRSPEASDYRKHLRTLVTKKADGGMVNKFDVLAKQPSPYDFDPN